MLMLMSKCEPALTQKVILYCFRRTLKLEVLVRYWTTRMGGSNSTSQDLHLTNTSQSDFDFVGNTLTKKAIRKQRKKRYSDNSNGG